MTALSPVKIRLYLIDDHALFREGLTRLLEGQADFEVAGGSGSVAAALTEMAGVRPDLVLLDVDLGGERALGFLAKARDLGFSGRVLIVTAGVSDSEAVRFIQEGASGILHKHNQPEVLCQAIRQVAAGDVYLEKRYMRALFETVDTTQEDVRPSLKEREVALLRLIFQGLANKEIAERLSLSESSVKASLRVLFEKLGVRTRSHLVRVALEQYRDQL